jgi:hypothetical protein
MQQFFLADRERKITSGVPPPTVCMGGRVGQNNNSKVTKRNNRRGKRGNSGDISIFSSTNYKLMLSFLVGKTTLMGG